MIGTGLRIALAAALLGGAAVPALALPVSGRVLGPGGAPVQGARAELIPEVGSHVEGRSWLGGRGGPAPAAATETDQDGRFALEAPGPGLWRVVVRAPGYVPLDAALHPLLHPAQLPPAILSLDAGHEVIVADMEGRPLAGAVVHATAVPDPSPPDDRQPLWAPAARLARTGPDGIAALPRAAGEVLEVRARSPLHAPSEATRSHGSRLLIRLAAAREAGGRPVVVELPAATRLQGRVVDAATSASVAGAVAWSDGTGAAVPTSAAGTFEVLASGPGPLHVAAPGYLRATVEVSPGGSEPLVVRLQPAAAVAGVVVDARGRPVPDAEVTTAPPLSTRLPAASGPDGRFRLDELPPATALVLGARLVHPGGPGPAAAPLSVSPLAPRERRQGLRLVLARGATVSGVVVAGAGRAAPEVAGARVRLTPLRAGAGPAAGVEVTTGLDGRFALAGLPAGRYRIDVGKPGSPAPDLPAVVIPERTDGLDLGRIALPRSVDLAGVVTDPAGRPIPGAEVRSTPTGGSDEPAKATTGEDGSFRLSGLREGARVDLAAEHPDYAPGDLAGVEVMDGPPVTLVLSPGARVSGRVVDEAGEGVADAVLMVWVSPAPREGEAARPVDGRQLAAAPDGGFEIRGLPPGEIRLLASAPEHQDDEISGLELREAEPLEGLELVLVAGAVLEGTVRTPRGAPLPHARVAVRPAGAGDPAGGGALAEGHQVDDAGRFRVDGLAPGPVLVQADHDRFRRAVRPFDLRPGRNRIDLVLEPGLAVAGRVLDEAGAPVAGARVGLREAGLDQAAVQSRADGSFRLTGLPAGRHEIEAEKEGFAPARLAVELAEAPVEGLELRLERGATLEGQLLGLGPEELARAEVSAFSPRLGVRQGAVESGGRYRILGIEPGDWIATASVPPGSRQAKAPVRIAEGAGATVVDLDFRQGLTLSGRALVDDAPLVGARVEVIGMAAQGAGAAVTGGAGEFTISGLEAGRYRLLVSDPAQGLSDEREIELPQDAGLEISLAAPRRRSP